MPRERLSAFVDAVIAIVMTILVLELEKPSEVTWEALWELRSHFFAYAVSFLWLGAMWINNHSEWYNVKRVSQKTVWLTVLMLFSASFFPYVTDLVSTHFFNSTAQILYGGVVLLITLMNLLMYASLREDNQDVEVFSSRMSRRNRWMMLDIVIKLVGLTLTIVVFPPAMLLSVLVTLLLIVVPQQLRA
ncbi:MAG: TMEM175 family protein [Propionibacteriaceae bacterium]|nr:DUF1211 domain-containing protein [Propionibacterium sp.]MDO4645601.1 TMEM175 family protein [Propionibacteriaceae bacterium]